MRMRLVAFGVACMLLAASASAASAQEVFVSFGSSVYDSDEFCLNSAAFITDYTVGASGSLLGATASFHNSDWPWPDPPGSTGGGGLVVPASFTLASTQQEDRFLSQGDAIAITAELFPLDAVRRITGGDRDGGISRLQNFIRPFVGVGVHISGDGETAAAGSGRDLPTHAVKGEARPIITYGARLYVPVRGRFRLQLQYHGTTMFVDEFEIEEPGGQTTTVESDNLMWGNWSVGVSVRVGG